jgi:hypothetical protein
MTFGFARGSVDNGLGRESRDKERARILRGERAARSECPDSDSPALDMKRAPTNGRSTGDRLDEADIAAALGPRARTQDVVGVGPGGRGQPI